MEGGDLKIEIEVTDPDGTDLGYQWTILDSEYSHLASIPGPNNRLPVTVSLGLAFGNFKPFSIELKVWDECGSMTEHTIHFK